MLQYYDGRKAGKTAMHIVAFLMHFMAITRGQEAAVRVTAKE